MWDNVSGQRRGERAFRLFWGPTSPLWSVSIAACTVFCMADHAHAAFPRHHLSCWSFLRGVKYVGHKAVFRVSWIGVTADEAGMVWRYGEGRLRSSGSWGRPVDWEAMRKLVVLLCFRTRFRWESSAVSRLACLSHLERVIFLSTQCPCISGCGNVLEKSCNQSLVWYVHDPGLDCREPA